ncbi:MAG: arginine--tRNA ligase [Opitutaceae bacterium]|nr:arginine--tRNA ligase [Opitutaceae bacterium]
MKWPFHIAAFIEDRILQASSGMEGFDDAFTPDVRPADARFGEFQANGVLPMAKRQKKNPRDLATRLVEAMEDKSGFSGDDLAMNVAGPGFINFRFMPGFYHEWLDNIRTHSDLQTACRGAITDKVVVVDFSSPNTAKQMHVGHIRSSVIGEALCRMLEFQGARTIRDNHIGDWGTQFGILLMAIHHFDTRLDVENDEALEELEELYRRGSKLTRESEEKLEEARQELVKLQNGDPENLSRWEQINSISQKAFQEIYNLLGIRFDYVLGESFYQDSVENVYTELESLGIAKESEGALVVFHPEHPRFKKQSFMVRKSDGASNYATTDLATILHRIQEWKAEEIIYVTDGRQQDHFEQLFLTARKWLKHHPEINMPKLRHVWFGTILGEDGKAIKTRSGEPIKLKDLLAEAIERARVTVENKNPDLDEKERDEVARHVGLGAVKYADLSQNRTGDYVFSWEKMLSLEGNTAPYLLYAVVRIRSIFRKAGLNPGEGEDAADRVETEEELALARQLLLFASALEQATSDLRPHILCTYLYDLAVTFSSFYNANKVMVDEEPTQARRLLLCARTLTVMETGLHLLGIETLEKM